MKPSHKNMKALLDKTRLLKTIELTPDKIDLACTFLLKVKDPNSLKIKSQKNGLENLPSYTVSFYKSENTKNIPFNNEEEAKNFVDTLLFLNKIGLE
jgi:hypothetical protein